MIQKGALYTPRFDIKACIVKFLQSMGVRRVNKLTHILPLYKPVIAVY